MPLREEIETTYANPTSISTQLITQRNRYATQLLLLLPPLKSWVDFSPTKSHFPLGYVSARRGQMINPRHCTSSRAGVGSVTLVGRDGWDSSPLEPFANARLLLNENARPGDITSPVIATHVIECLLERAQYITAKLNTTGVETGDFTYNGYITRAAKLSASPGFSWLSRELIWQQNGRRVASVSASRFVAYPTARAISTVVAPCDGLIWLGDLSLLNPAGNPAVDPYAQYTKFAVLEFDASYNDGGIGALVQPLIGERIFGTFTPNWQG